jgi:hypothetical protein
VVEAIKVLNGGRDQSRMDQASAYLEGIQLSPHAWQVADGCLQQKISKEVSFFAAQTMRRKIQSYFHELPAESHAQLRASLLAQLQSFGSTEGNKIVVTQLTLAMADLAIQMIPLKTWPNPLTDLVKLMGDNPAWAPALLEVLKELPNELDNRFMPYVVGVVLRVCGRGGGVRGQRHAWLQIVLRACPCCAAATVGWFEASINTCGPDMLAASLPAPTMYLQRTHAYTAHIIFSAYLTVTYLRMSSACKLQDLARRSVTHCICARIPG